MTEPSLVPVENRLRRTFGARAEDMAPGDTDDADPIPPLALTRSPDRTPERRLRRPVRPVLVAAGVLVVALVAAAVAVVAGRDDGESSDDVATASTEASPGDATVALVTAPRDVVMALADERNMAVLGLTGIEDTVQTPVADDAEARRGTDEAIATLRALLADTPGGPQYERLLGALQDLDQLRGDVDADPGPRDLSHTVAAQAIFDRYGEILTGVLDAHAAYVLDIGDGPLREGAEAYTQGLRLEDLTTRLVRIALLTGIAQQGPHPIDGLSALLTETEGDLDRLGDLTGGTPYEDAATAVADEMRTSGLLDEARRVLGGTLDVVALLEATDDIAESGWPVYLDRVEEILAEQG